MGPALIKVRNWKVLRNPLFIHILDNEGKIVAVDQSAGDIPAVIKRLLDGN
jgi:hypothetical protein